MRRVSRDFFKGSTPIFLVAGGAGFVGSHLCEALLKKGVKVLCIDNWLTGVRENISHLKEDTNFLFVEHDISKALPQEIERLNYIVHLAGVEAYLNGEDISIETLEANSLGTKNLLDKAVGEKCRFLFVSTIGVYSAKLSPSDISQYFGKERVNEGEFSQHEAKRFAEALTSEYGQKHNIDARIVRVGEVYGPRMMLSNARPLSGLVKQAVYGGPLNVPGGEETVLFPVFIDDVINGISKALFSSGTKNKIITLAGPKTTLFSIAQTLKTVAANNKQIFQIIGKELEVEFMDNKFPQNPIEDEVLYSGRDAISWEPKITVDQGLSATLLWFLENKSRVPMERKETQKKKKGDFWEGRLSGIRLAAPHFSFKKKGLLLFGVVFLLVWYFVLPFLFLGIAAGHLILAKNNILDGGFPKGHFWAGGAVSWATHSKNGFLKWQKVPLLGDSANTQVRNAGLIARASQITQALSSAAAESEKITEGIFGDESFNPQNAADSLALELQILERELAFLETELGEEGLTRIPLVKDIRISKSLEISEIRRFIRATIPVLAQTEDLLGVTGKRTYLVLLQNNMEIRPTGGFIGSFALVTFEKGRLINLEVQDVYSADGQLKGHVEPPEPIKKYLGEGGWFLRDSNWSPDFPTTAKRAAWFIDKEIGQEVHGAVAVDLEVIKKIIELTGPLTLVDFNEEITAQNLYEKTQYAVEGDFFPGSRAKKDFLTALSRTLLQRLFPDEADKRERAKSLISLLRATVWSLEQRHMAVWVSNENVALALKREGWDGSLRNVVCRDEETCVSDYAMLVEANLGVNKANYFLDRTLSLELTEKEEEFEHQLVVTYRNRSESGVWPGGDYKNFLRVFVPENAVFSSAWAINPENGKQDGLDVEESIERFAKKSGGFLVTVPGGQSRQVVIKWKTPFSAKIPGVNNLVFMWQKQLGLPADPVWVNFKFSERNEILSVAPTLSLTTASGVGYNTELTKDLLFNIRWQTQP